MSPEELNEAVARVLGIKKELPGCCPDHPVESGAFIPSYSTSIAAAWEIVEHLKTNYKTGAIVSIWLRFDSIRHWIFGFCDSRDSSKKPIEYEAEADTAPRAICEAFLKLP